MTEPAAAAEARLSPTPLRGWPQRLLHLAALVAGWGLFFWGWHDVLGQHWDTTALIWLIAGSLVLLPAMTIAWVLHNVGIHRRKGPRTGLRKVDETYRHDWNGREISADFAALGARQRRRHRRGRQAQGVSGRRRPADGAVDRHADAASPRGRQCPPRTKAQPKWPAGGPRDARRPARHAADTRSSSRSRWSTSPPTRSSPASCGSPRH